MSMSATEAVTSRRSVRAFTDRAVPEQTLRMILTDSAPAASGTNIQPWHVTVLQGASGLYIGNVMTLAREHGLDTCPQAAWRDFESIIHAQLELPADHQVVVEMALGYQDTNAVINQLRTERADLDEFVDFRS